VSEKYHKIPQNKYKSMKGREQYLIPDENIAQKVIKRYIWKVISSLLAVTLLVFHEQIYYKANEWLSRKGKDDSKEKNE
jgi:hypothetical protein